MSKHHLRNFAAPSSKESAKRILEEIDEKNRNKKLLQGKLQKMAVRYESSFGPDLDAIEAFKKGTDYQGYVGRGKNTKLKFEVKGNKLYLHGHNIATKTKDGIEVSNAGFDTGLTYSTLKELGINAKRTPGGKVILHKQEIDAASGQPVFVPINEISSTPIRATKPQKKQKHNRTVTEQSTFRKQVEDRERREQGRNERELPLASTVIQPKDQRVINKITGVKSKIPKETRATSAHHIFPVEKYPELKSNPSQGIMLTRAEHKELHELNPTESMKALRRKVGKIQRIAGIKPMVRKKKKGKAIKKIAPKVGMIQTAKMMSADAIINSYNKIKPDIKGKSGVYDPVENRILDARIPMDAIRLQNFFESGQNSIGFNSVTDTRQGPMEDIETVRSQLKQIEQTGGVPALGFDEGSLEALDVKIGSENDIMTNLLENQRSTVILDYNLQFKIEDNPKFRKN